MGGTHCTVQTQHLWMDYKKAWKTEGDGSGMAKTSQRTGSVEAVQGRVPPYRAIETLVVDGPGTEPDPGVVAVTHTCAGNIKMMVLSSPSYSY